MILRLRPCMNTNTPPPPSTVALGSDVVVASFERHNKPQPSLPPTAIGLAPSAANVRRDTRAYALETTAMHDNEYTPCCSAGHGRYRGLLQTQAYLLL